LITGKLYDYLKYLAQIVLPALGTLYFGLAGIWDLPSAQEVVGTIVVVDTFLGVLLGISQNNYNKSDARFDGAINVNETEERKQFSLELKGDPDEIDKKDQVVFKVNKP
jgi:hypothetical protein